MIAEILNYLKAVADYNMTESESIRTEWVILKALSGDDTTPDNVQSLFEMFEELEMQRKKSIELDARYTCLIKFNTCIQQQHDALIKALNESDYTP